MMDARSKAALTFLFVVLAFTTTWEVQIVATLVVLALPFTISSFSFQSQRSRRAFHKFIVYAFTITLVLVLVNGIFIKDGRAVEFLWGIALHESGLLFGLRTATRLLLLISSLLVFFLSTPLRTIGDEMQNAGVPPPVVSALLLAFFFLGRMPARVEQIFAAQESRGATVRGKFLSRVKSFLTILGPLVLSSISESVERGMALELRGFQSHVAVIRREPSKTSLLAWAFLSVSLALVAWSIIQWLLK